MVRSRSWLLIIGLSFIGAIATVTPTLASGDYYVNPSSGAALDTNTCRSAEDPCATVTGALTVISASANPKNSKIHLSGTVAERIVITDPDLQGLTIVGGIGDQRPTIDATGQQQAIYINRVDDVTLKQLEIIHAEEQGIYASGGEDSHLEGINITNVLIHDFTNTKSTRTGISLVSADNVLVQKNTIHDIGGSYTDVADVNYSMNVYGMVLNNVNHAKVLNNTIENLNAVYTATTVAAVPYVNVYGINLYYTNDITVRGNTLKNISSTSSVQIDVNYGFTYAYGVYGYYMTDGRFRKNKMIHVSSTTTSAFDGVGTYAYAYGMSLIDLHTGIVRENTVKNLASTATVQDEEATYAYANALFINAGDYVTVKQNTIQNSTSSATTGAGNALMYSYYFNNIDGLDIERNVTKNTTATHSGTGQGKNTALFLQDTPQVNVFHNRLVDFDTAAIAEDSRTSIGIDVRYNSSADMLNNLVYFTGSPDATQSVKGVVVTSQQATPVRVFHNTFSNMTTCVDIDDMKIVEVKNTMCRFTTSGANVYEVDSADYDMTGFTSNGNSYYTTVGTLSFLDNDTGTMTFADWKAAYDIDKKSLNKNPLLNVNDPTKKGYLHLKKDSPLIDAGLEGVEFTGDSVMINRMERDWDNEKRPHGPLSDIGADEWYQ